MVILDSVIDIPGTEQAPKNPAGGVSPVPGRKGYIGPSAQGAAQADAARSAPSSESTNDLRSKSSSVAARPGAIMKSMNEQRKPAEDIPPVASAQAPFDRTVLAAPPTTTNQGAPKPVARSSNTSAKRAASRKRNRLATGFLVFAIIATAAFFSMVAAGAIVYARIASEVPDPSQLLASRSRFASTKVYDGSGSLLVELTDATDMTAGRRVYVPFEQMSEWVWKATTATEDPNFFRYSVGFDPRAILRVFYYLLTEREFVSGGSTITQQVVRNLLLSPDERNSRTASRKIRELVFANELARRADYPREKILEIYLNEINYGNLAYGIEAAAQTYFNKHAKDLTVAEAAFLAGIPQSPVYWDPVAHEDRTLLRMTDVLRLMVQAGYINESQVAPAVLQMGGIHYKPSPVNVAPIAPHFMNYLRAQLDITYGRRQFEEPGLRVFTSLSPTVQAIAEQAITENITKLALKHVTNGAAVVMNPRTGEVLAMVGSVDFYSETIKGQVDVAIASRQPGSSIKPFTYLAMLEKGASPATLFWDVRTTFTDKYGQQYTPTNYDNTFHGGVLMRESLARSLNVPAVLALDNIGLPAFFDITHRAGINFPPNPQYGLAVTLGGAETRLLDLTGGYAALANGGNFMTPTLISRIETNDGKVLFDIHNEKPIPVFTPQHAYLITSILSDNSARSKSFGPNSVLNTTRPTAVKTGTTNDTRDNLTIGYTPDLVVGVWAGNTDNTAMKNVTGVEGAAPIWRQIIDNTLKGKPAQPFLRPPGLIEAEICLDGGHIPSDACPTDRRAKEIFKQDQGPLASDENLERGVRAGDPNYASVQPALDATPSSEVKISNPPNGGTLGRALLSIRGVVNPPGFERYQVEWGVGDSPAEWKWISGPHLSPVTGDQITQWSTEGLPNGHYTIRVTATAGGVQLFGYSRFEVK